MTALEPLRASLETDVHFEALRVPLPLVWRLRRQRLVLRELYRTEIEAPPSPEQLAAIQTEIEAVCAEVPAYPVVREWFSVRSTGWSKAVRETGAFQRVLGDEFLGGWRREIEQMIEDAKTAPPMDFSLEAMLRARRLPEEEDEIRHAGGPGPRDTPSLIQWDVPPPSTPLVRGHYALQILRVLLDRDTGLAPLRAERDRLLAADCGHRLAYYRLYRSRFPDAEDTLRDSLGPPQPLTETAERMLWLAEELTYHDAGSPTANPEEPAAAPSGDRAGR